MENTVVDTACPEILIPLLLDPSRKTIRVLMLPELEARTVVLEDREGGRYAAIFPGPRKVNSVTVDPDEWYPDIRRENNRWPAGFSTP